MLAQTLPWGAFENTVVTNGDKSIGKNSPGELVAWTLGDSTGAAISWLTNPKVKITNQSQRTATGPRSQRARTREGDSKNDSQLSCDRRPVAVSQLAWK